MKSKILSFLKNNVKNILIVILTLLLSFLFWTNRNITSQVEALNIKLSDTVVYLQNKSNELIAIKDVEISSNQESLKELREKLFNTEDKLNKQVKEVKALIAQKSKIEYKDVLIPYKDTTGKKQWEDSVVAKCSDVINYINDSTVKIGTKASDSTKWYNVDLTINKNGITIDTLNIIDSQYVSIVKMKGGFFKRNTNGKLKLFLPSKTRVEILHKNPNIKTVGIDSYIFEKKNTRGYGAGILHGSIIGFIFSTLIKL